MSTESDQHSSGQIGFQINLGNENVAEWRSNEEMIGEFKWCMKAKRIEQNDETILSIAICCNENCCLDQLWLAKIDFSLESKDAKEFNFVMKDEYFYNECERTIRYVLNGTKCNWPKRIENLYLTLKLKLFGSCSNTNIMALDTDLRFSFPNNEEENKEMEKVIRVNKYALASISGYFHNLFFGNWSERSSNSNSFAIKEEAGFDWKAFALMVYSSMAMGCMAHESGILNNTQKNETMAMAILKLSIKYDMPVMQNSCEKHLIQSEKCSKVELLELAEQLGLQKLIEHALRTITPLDVGEDFGRYSDVRAQLSEKTRNELDKRLAGKTKELKTELNELRTKLEKKRKNNEQDCYRFTPRYAPCPLSTQQPSPIYSPSPPSAQQGPPRYTPTPT